MNTAKQTLESKADFEASLHFNRKDNYDRWWACRCCYIAGTKALSAIGEGWIDIKDQLPEKVKKDNILNISEPVLVISDDVVDAVPRTDYWDYNKGHWWSAARGSHWIYISVFRKYFPLPNPPSLTK